MGVGDMDFERRPADDGRVGIGVRQTQILDQRHGGGAGLGGGAEHAVHVLQIQPGVIQGTTYALRHEVEGTH